jgi:hypothetical protein
VAPASRLPTAASVSSPRRPMSSMRGLPAYVAFTCVLLGVARLPSLAGCAALVVDVVSANFIVPTRLWRFVVYGGIAGVAAASVALGCYLEFGIPGPHTYTDGRLEVLYGTRPYVVHVGALVGGSAGLVASTVRAKAAA